MSEFAVPVVPYIGCGLWSEIEPHLKTLTEGESALCAGQIREGLVIKSRHESYHPRYGRKIAKSVSEAYLLRKGAITEFS